MSGCKDEWGCGSVWGSASEMIHQYGQHTPSHIPRVAPGSELPTVNPRILLRNAPSPKPSTSSFHALHFQILHRNSLCTKCPLSNSTLNTVVVCTDLSGNDLHKQVGMDTEVTSRCNC